MRATPARVPSVLFSCRHSLYRFHSRPLPHSLLSLCSRSFFFSPFLSPRSFSRSACHPLSLLSVSLYFSLALALTLFPCSRSRSFRHRLPTAPSYPRGNPRTASVPLRHPPTAPTATTRVYKPDQPGSTYLPFRIIRLACRPLLHAEFRLIKMRLRGRGRARVVSARRPRILIRASTVRHQSEYVRCSLSFFLCFVFHGLQKRTLRSRDDCESTSRRRGGRRNERTSDDLAPPACLNFFCDARFYDFTLLLLAFAAENAANPSVSACKNNTFD